MLKSKSFLRGKLLGSASAFAHPDQVRDGMIGRHLSGVSPPPPPTNSFTMGALTKAGVLAFPTAATAITSGDAGGHWQITGGFLSPSTAGDAAEMNAGPYTLVLNNSTTVMATIEANCYDVATQANYDAIATAANITPATGGTIAFVNAGPWNTHITDAFGEMGRRVSFAVPLVFKSRYPKTAKALLSQPVATRSNNMQWRSLIFPTQTATKLTWFTAPSQCNNMVCDDCEFYGIFNPAATSHATWANANAISDGGGSAGSSGWTITNCIFQYNDAAVLCSAINVTITGNLIMDWWALGIHLSVPAGALGANWDVSQNVLIGPHSQGVNDTDGVGLTSHPDTILFTGTPSATVHSVVRASMNRFVQGGRPGRFIGLTMRDHTGTFKFQATVEGNVMAGAETVEAITIEDGINCVVRYNTAFGRGTGPSGSYAALNLAVNSSLGSHIATGNLCETITSVAGAVVNKTSNVEMGLKAPAVVVLTAVTGPTLDMSSFASTLADVMSNFNIKAGAAAALNSGQVYGAIGSGAVRWASTVPGNDGAILL